MGVAEYHDAMEYLFVFLLFTVAFLYSSVGHGGGSGYLALMALFGMAPETMRPTSLSLNVFVSLVAFLAYYKAGYFRPRLVFPFLVTSVPMAYVGALIKINPFNFKIILGIFLLAAIGRMLFIPSSVSGKSTPPPLVASFLIGAVLGLFSGMIGIGGGIILSPVLLLMHWANMKETAAASALFIFLNSVAGLIGLFQGEFVVGPHWLIWVVAGVLGSLAGSYSGSFRMKSEGLKYILAVTLLVASLKLFII